jgi:hypothetical protein
LEVRPRPVTAAIASGIVWLAACAPFGADATPADDGGLTRDGSMPDAAGDGGGAGDAADDARSTVSPCLGATHRVCEDFDQNGTLESRGWTIDTTNGGHVVVDTGDSRSVPKSVVMTNPTLARATISQTFTGGAAGDLRLSFDVRARKASQLIIATIVIETYEVRLGVRADGSLNIDEVDRAGNQPQVDHDVGAKVTDAWVTIELLVHFVLNKASGSAVTITLNGVVSKTAPLTPSVGTGAPRIFLGVVDGPASLNELRFDNVIFDGP